MDSQRLPCFSPPNFPRANFSMNPGIFRPLGQSFQQNSQVPFTNFPPPNLQCPAGPYTGRPSFPTFGDSSARPAPRLGDSINTLPFRPRLDQPPPLHPERNFSRPPNECINTAPFMSNLNQPPPSFRHDSPSFSDHGKHMSSPPFMPSFEHPQQLSQEYSLLRTTNQHGNSQPLQSSTQPKAPTATFDVRSSYKRHFTPWNQKPAFIHESPFRGQPRGPANSHTSREYNKTNTNQFKKFRNRDNRKLKDSPDNGVEKPFSCDRCDRAFALIDQLNAHFSEHIKCNSQGCNFEAHPKIVALHKKMQHDTGYASAINKLQSAEEIEKWRAERKRRFPTAENILKRKAEQAEKIARGEVLENKEFGKFKKGKFEPSNMRRGHSHQNGRRGGRFRNRPPFRPKSEPRFQYSHKMPKTMSDSDSDSDSHIKLNKFLGMSSLTSINESQTNIELNVKSESSKCLKTDNKQADLVASGSDSDIVDIPNNESFEKSTEESCQLPLVLNSEQFYDNCNNVSEDIALDSELIQIDDTDEEPKLIAEIQKEIPIEVSDTRTLKKVQMVDLVTEESDDEPPMVVPIKKEKCNDIEPTEEENTSSEKSSVKNSIRHDRSLKEIPSVDNVANDPSPNKNTARTFRNNQHDRHNGKDFRRDFVLPRKSSLLEKLLADDIRHERNVILQCVHYIVKKNFFGIGD